MGRSSVPPLLLLLVLFVARGARAQDLPASFHADDLSLDASTRELDARGHVRVDVPPFYLTSEHLKLKRAWYGIDVDGEGRLGWCPCLGTPLAVGFDGARVAPPYDVILKSPRLELYGVPVLWSPVWWLRSPARPGLLAPDVEYRGADGMFLGEGVHLPLRPGDADEGFDLRAGGYLKGGAAVDARLYTATTSTRVRYDHLAADGLTIDSRGSTRELAWDVDAIRGARGVASTTELEPAARVFDRADAQEALRADDWTVASGVRAVALRGSNVLALGAAGPVAAARRSGALGDAGAFDATAEGGGLAGAGVGTLSFARAEAGALLATRVGAAATSLAFRGVGDVADDGAREGADGVAQARARIGLPLVRAFDSGDPLDPWVHRIDPHLDGAVVGERGEGVLGAAFGRGVVSPAAGRFSDVAGVATAGLSSTSGRWGSHAASTLDAAAGLVGDAQATRAALRWRLAWATRWLGGGGEGAYLAPTRPGAGDGGQATFARLRLGRADALNVTGLVAGRDGVDPTLARALVDAPLEPASGFLDAEGWTGGARVAIPVAVVALKGGADADLTSGRLVAALGSLEFTDPCGCMVVRASGAHRIGRDGVDVWLTVDFPRLR